jgi:hypothetical protein
MRYGSSRYGTSYSGQMRAIRIAAELDLQHRAARRAALAKEQQRHAMRTRWATGGYIANAWAGTWVDDRHWLELGDDPDVMLGAGGPLDAPHKLPAGGATSTGPICGALLFKREG